MLQDFHFTALTSKASPNLMLACATGRHFQRATLTCRKAGGSGQVEFLKIKLDDCLVSSYRHRRHYLRASDALPTDQFSLNFVKIDFLYTNARTGETVETSLRRQGAHLAHESKTRRSDRGVSGGA